VAVRGHWETFRFQFLIGRLRTQELGTFKKSLSQFQFLIGRLRTVLEAFVEETLRLFQFLIGRLRTYCAGGHLLWCPVSIPHR